MRVANSQSGKYGPSTASRRQLPSSSMSRGSHTARRMPYPPGGHERRTDRPNGSALSGASSGELVRPDVDEVDHDRAIARIADVVNTEQVEASDGTAVNGQSSPWTVGHRDLIPCGRILAQRLEHRSKVDPLELRSSISRKLPIDVFQRSVGEAYGPQPRRSALSIAAWCSSAERRRSASSAAGESGSSARWKRTGGSAASSISCRADSMASR